MKFLQNFGFFTFVACSLLLYLKPVKERIIPAILSLMVLFQTMNAGIDKLTILELSMLISIFLTITHCGRFRTSGLYFISFFVIGCFSMAIVSSHKEIIGEVFNKVIIIENGEEYVKFITDAITIFAILFILGCFPFSRWIMYLFSISSSFYGIVCFIIPMFVSLLIFRDLSFVLSTKSLFYIGAMICIYCGFCMLYDNKLRHILSYVIAYFFAIQIMVLPEDKSLIMVFSWLFFAVLILSFKNVFLPARMRIYDINQIKQFVCMTTRHKIMSAIVLSITISYFALFCFLLNTYGNNPIKIASLSLFICFLAKLVNICVFGKKAVFNIYYQLKLVSIIKILFPVLSLIIFCAMNFTKILALCSMLEKYEIAIYLGIIIVSIPLSNFFIRKYDHKTSLIQQEPEFSKFILLVKSIKIALKMVSGSIKDFSVFVIEKLRVFFNGRYVNQLSEILGNNVNYAYIVFLFVLIIVLTIECIIL